MGSLTVGDILDPVGQHVGVPELGNSQSVELLGRAGVPTIRRMGLGPSFALFSPWSCVLALPSPGGPLSCRYVTLCAPVPVTPRPSTVSSSPPTLLELRPYSYPGIEKGRLPPRQARR